MLKSEAERILRRALEDNEVPTTFTDEQIQAICEAMMKIAARTVEEAFANYRPGSGNRPSFFG